MVTTSTIGQMDAFQPELESFSTYKARLRLFLDANAVEEGRRVPVMLTVIGPKHYALLHHLVAPDDPATKSIDELLELLQKHFEPTPLVIAERFKFYRRTQENEETVAQFVAELRRLATHCNFGGSLHEAIRDRLVCGMKLSLEGAQKKLLSISELTLDKAVQVASSYEAIQQEAKELQRKSTMPSSNEEVLAINSQVKLSVCFRCGKSGHNPQQCRCRSWNCHKCGKLGHIATVCRSKPTRSPGTLGRGTNSARTATNLVDSTPPATQSDSDEEMGLFNIDTVGGNTPPIKINMTINKTVVELLVDTGAAVTLISEDVFRSLRDCHLEETSITLTSYTSEEIPLLGKSRVLVRYGDQEQVLTLYVAKGNRACLLGRDWLQVIRLDWNTIASVHCLKKSQESKLLEEFKDVFEISKETGTIKGMKAKLTMREEANPRFYRPRPVPFALKAAVSQELDRLVDKGVLERVDSSPWATPIVVVPKKTGGLRICGDYKLTVNPSLDVDTHPLPRSDELFASLAGGRVFTKIDLANAYQQMLLEEESRAFVTINTHKGLFRYTRLPFGIASAPAIFQRAMDTVLAGIPHTACYIDDIIITGKSEAEHMENLREVLKRLQAYGLKAKRAKCEFFCTSVNYLGFVLSSSGLATQSCKTEAIVNAPEPSNVRELRSFLGFVNYYRQFIPHLSSILAPLNSLLRKGAPWKWTKACSTAFQKAKANLQTAPVLMHYDSTLPIVLATDASSYGLGAVLSHIDKDGIERPVAFASRTLSVAERNYAQLEREALSIVYGIKRFHQYLYGRKFKLITDHKPLTTIFGPKTGIPTLAAARLQRWALLLSAYSFDVVYRGTLEHANADGLSRLPLPGGNTKVSVDVAAMFNIVQLSSLPLTHIQMRTATRSDPVLSKVLQAIKEGWHTAGFMSGNEGEWTKYWQHREELTTEAGCILRGVRAVVPPKLRQAVLHELHVGHQGVTRMKARARSCVWWPSLQHDIEENG